MAPEEEALNTHSRFKLKDQLRQSIHFCLFQQDDCETINAITKHNKGSNDKQWISSNTIVKCVEDTKLKQVKKATWMLYLSRGDGTKCFPLVILQTFWSFNNFQRMSTTLSHTVLPYKTAPIKFDKKGHWYPGSGVVLDCIDSWSLPSFLLLVHWHALIWAKIHFKSVSV